MTYQEAAKAAIDIQNACNMGGVARTFHEAVQAVWDEAHRRQEGTDWVNQHPLIRMFIDKMNDLSGRIDHDTSQYRNDWHICEEIVKGNG